MNVQNVTDLLSLLLKLFDVLEPGIAAIVQDWADSKKTAEEADAAAQGKFTAMLVTLANPKADEATLNAAEDQKLTEKFLMADKEEPK
jgi:hypothetical protein